MNQRRHLKQAPVPCYKCRRTFGNEGAAARHAERCFGTIKRCHPPQTHVGNLIPATFWSAESDKGLEEGYGVDFAAGAGSETDGEEVGVVMAMELDPNEGNLDTEPDALPSQIITHMPATPADVLTLNARDFLVLLQQHPVSNLSANAFLRYMSRFPDNGLPECIEGVRERFDAACEGNCVWKEEKLASYGGEVTFRFRDLLDVADELIEAYSPNIVWEDGGDDGEGVKVWGDTAYGEPWTGTWFKDALMLIPRSSKLVGLILYADGTALDGRETKGVHPVYLSLVNIPLHLRNKLSAKRVVAYIPSPTPKDAKDAKTDAFSTARRVLYHDCVRLLLEPLKAQYAVGRTIEVDGRRMRVCVLLAFCIFDWVEAGTASMVYSTWNAKRCCHSCLLESAQFPNWDIVGVPRTEKFMKKLLRAFRMKTTIEEFREIPPELFPKVFSFHPEENAFWGHL